MRITAASVLTLLVFVVADAADAATRPRLKAFNSCKSLVEFAKTGALRTQGGVGVDGRAAPVMVDAVVTPQIAPPPQRTNDMPTSAPMPVSAEGNAGGGSTPEFSGTNVQEIGVDEPDIVKTDGRRIFAVTDRTLRVVDPASGLLAGTLALDGFGHRLLLRGDRVLVVASKGATYDTSAVSRPVAPEFAPVSSATIVTELDVSAATPKVMRTMEVPGRFVDARQNGGTARLVIDSEPEPFIATPTDTVSEQVREAGTRDFLQRTVLRSKLSGKTYRRALAPCKAITHPAQFSGTGVLAILTVDLDRGMYSLDRDGVMAGAQVVYGSDKNLYVASRRYVRALELGQDVPEGVRTEIHRFDISNPERTVYRSTGTVPGFILNNYALSEFDGHLRVASTEEPQWFPGGGGTQSQSMVTVLKEDGARLVRVGSVSGLGQGERIYAVRFMGDKGYVVTFRQIDPLYTLDLSQHDAPKVVGELKIPGYSAYLHPVGPDRLLGVGREGINVQASLFDVSNMAAPTRLAQLDFGAGATPVESEPHAFLYWGPANLAVMPLSNYDPEFEGAVGVRIGATTLSQVGTIAHRDAARDRNAPVERSFVIGDRLYTLSWHGLASNGLGDLAAVRYTAF
jgi:uncharacterized secreted protein with C-terminal beta-propeller domain